MSSRDHRRYSNARRPALWLVRPRPGSRLGGDTSFWLLSIPVLRFAVLPHRHDRSSAARDAAARRRLLRTRPGPDRGPLDRHGRARRTVSRRSASSSERPRSVRPGSLFELLSIARTRAGEETLAGWLKRPATPCRRDPRPPRGGARADPAARSPRGAGARRRRRAGRRPQRRAGRAGPRHRHPSARQWFALGGRPAHRHRHRELVACLASGDIRPLSCSLVAAGACSHDRQRRAARSGARTRPTVPARDLDVLARSARTPGARSVPCAAARRAAPAISAQRHTGLGRIRRLHRLVEAHDWQHNIFFAAVLAAASCGARTSRGRSRRGGAARRHIGHGSTRSASSRRSRRCRPIDSSIPDDPFPDDRRADRRPAHAHLRGPRPRPPAAARGAHGAQRRAPRRRDAAARRQRLEHVGQEHAAANRRHQRRAGAGRRAGARRSRCASRRWPSARRCASRTRCRRADRASTRRSRASAQMADLARGPRAAAVPARRALSRHQLARSARRRRGRAAQPARSRRHRPDHHARSRLDGHRRERWRRAPRTCTSRTGSRPARCLRLPSEAGPRHAEQRARADARGRLDVRRRG